jgi:hypothetical protein
VPEVETTPLEAHAADGAAAEIVGEPAPEPVATSTEIESEAVAAAPDDASEAAVEEETLPEPEATADGEATE